MAKGLQGELIASYDRNARILTLVGRGVWTIDMLREHQVEIADVSALARRDRDALLVYSDLTEAGVQTREIGQEIASFTPRAFRPSDRIATVVGSSLWIGVQKGPR